LRLASTVVSGSVVVVTWLATWGALALVATPAFAYEFHVEATSTGQGYQVRWLRAGESDRWLNRRRFTQTLRLEVWDILAPAGDPGHPEVEPKAPFQLYFTSSIRFDHDFGDYAAGTVAFDDRGVMVRQDARTLVPELDEDTLQLDVPYAYVGGNDLGGFLDFRLGRQLEVQTFDWYAFDGLAVTVHTPLHLALEVHGGLVVRGASLFGTPAHEPDGTGSGDCARFESSTGGWIPSDTCAQRHELMPGFGLALATDGIRGLHARIAYRRAESQTAADTYPGTGGWGVNEEKLVAEARGELGPVEPFAAARYDLVLALVDEAEAGLRLELGNHAVTPAVAYSAPTFDADSIFNVFASEPYRDLRLDYDVRPWHGRWRGFARSYLRHFEPSADAVGVTVGTAVQLDRGRARFDFFHDTGHGGARVGSDLSGSVQVHDDLALDGRLTVIASDDDLASERSTTFGAQAGVRWTLAHGAALHFIAEENSNHYQRNQLRVMAILDLAFTPEI
jgi:hypothetical protein